MSVQAVIFDMDGVLVDSEPFGFEAMRRVVARYGLGYTEAENAEFLGRTTLESCRILKGRHQLPESEETLAGWYIEEMLALIAQGPSPMPGVPEVLHRLRAAGHPLALASSGRMYDERLGKLHFWLTFVSFNVTFFPMHYVGLRGMPRRVSDYAAAFGDMNFVITVASFVLGASFVIFVYNMVMSWARGPIAGSNPWRAQTLEWQVSSPPPIFNFDEIPQVVAGPYEYGVPGARHAVMSPSAREAEEVHA